MSKKVILYTYRLKITKNKNEHLFSQFNGSPNHDYLEELQFQLEDLFNGGRKKITETKSGDNRYLKLLQPAKIDFDNRRAYGWINTGINGSDGHIDQGEYDIVEFSSDDTLYKKAFFYIDIPKDEKYGTLVVQRFYDVGLKGIMSTFLNNSLKNRGFGGLKVHLTSIMNKKVFNKFLDYGTLRSVNFVQNGIPADIDDAIHPDNEQKSEKLKHGRMIRKIMTNNAKGLPRPYVNWIKRKVQQKGGSSSNVELFDNSLDTDEVEFVLAMNGSKRTYYLNDADRGNPSVDITNQLKFDRNKNPTINSILKACEALVEEVNV